MKVWFTLPFDDAGIQAASLSSPDSHGWRHVDGGGALNGCRLWGWDHLEGIEWHRTKKGALKKAAEYRAARMSKALDDVAHIRSLPAIGTSNAS